MKGAGTIAVSAPFVVSRSRSFPLIGRQIPDIAGHIAHPRAPLAMRHISRG